MAEYIEREAAIKKKKTEEFCDAFVTKWMDEKVLAWIRNLPAADVAPVVHGRWLEIQEGNLSLWNCSECKTLGSPQWKGCPVCLARMDGE